jgi:hypothetical protein
LSGLRIQSLTKAPRTPLPQDFKGVKKSDRCTRITSSSRISHEIIKEKRRGIKKFFFRRRRRRCGRGGTSGLGAARFILGPKFFLMSPSSSHGFWRQLRQLETSAKSHFVILSGAKDLVLLGSYEILRSLRSLRMTGEGTFAEVSTLRSGGGCATRKTVLPVSKARCCWGSGSGAGSLAATCPAPGESCLTVHPRTGGGCPDGPGGRTREATRSRRPEGPAAFAG